MKEAVLDSREVFSAGMISVKRSKWCEVSHAVIWGQERQQEEKERPRGGNDFGGKEPRYPHRGGVEGSS